MGNGGSKGERRSPVVDPAVAAILGDGDRREVLRGRSPAQRRQARRDEGRNKVTVDLPQWLETALREVVRERECGLSGMTAWLLAVGLREYRAGRVTPELERATSLKYLWDVVVSEGADG